MTLPLATPRPGHRRGGRQLVGRCEAEVGPGGAQRVFAAALDGFVPPLDY